MRARGAPASAAFRGARGSPDDRPRPRLRAFRGGRAASAAVSPSTTGASSISCTTEPSTTSDSDETAGLVSLAHPGRTRIDRRIPELAAAGLDALEVYHPDHDELAVDRYRHLASQHGLHVTGGSDFHGDPAYGLEPGAATLPQADWDSLFAARDRHAGR